jgi:hypothetical protein
VEKTTIYMPQDSVVPPAGILHKVDPSVVRPPMQTVMLAAHAEKRGARLLVLADRMRTSYGGVSDAAGLVATGRIRKLPF